MCTAVWDPAGGLFGRTLDLEYTYDEQVTVSDGIPWGGSYPMVGMATVADGYPLYYDAVNGQGLAMAGLHFPRSCVYPPPRTGMENVGSYALIPTLLSRCATVEEAKEELGRIHLCDQSFSAAYSATPLHWMLADRRHTAVVEATATGVQVYDNPAGVLTNEPPLPHQFSHLSHYAHLSPLQPVGQWQSPVSRGGGAVGMPGDYTSPSRFVRAAFGAAHAPVESEEGQVSAYFRRMAAVEIPRGWVQAEDGRWVVTHYTCCMDLAQGVYYYRTAGCHRITAVRFPDTVEDTPVCYPLRRQEDVRWENG